MRLHQTGALLLISLAGFLHSASLDRSTVRLSPSSVVVGDTGFDVSAGGGYAVDTIASPPFPLMHADTVDGVVFAASTDKTIYKTGEPIRVRYRIKNRSMGTVVYDFNTSCQFDVRIDGSRGGIVYSLLPTEPCRGAPSRLQLPPSAETVREFPPVTLRLKKTDTLTVKAQMAGYPLSTVPVRIVYETAMESSIPVALEGSYGHQPVLEFNHETRMLIIRIDRAQRLTISAFISTGKKANKLSCEKFLEPGTHLISFNNKKLADGVVIFKVEGNGFSETKTINLSR
jgi:hypothetical protein